MILMSDGLDNESTVTYEEALEAAVRSEAAVYVVSKTQAVRQAIIEDAPSLRKIISRPRFAKYFGKTLPGRRLRTAPRDVPRDHPDIDLLQLTSFEIWTDIKDSRLRQKDFVGQAVGVFEAMHDYVHWLNRALDRFRAPSSPVAVHK